MEGGPASRPQGSKFYSISYSTINGSFSHYSFEKLSNGELDVLTNSNKNDWIAFTLDQAEKIESIVIKSPFSGGTNQDRLNNGIIQYWNEETKEWLDIIKIGGMDKSNLKEFYINKFTSQIRIHRKEIVSGCCVGLGQLIIK